jgi:hypothetical protein
MKTLLVIVLIMLPCIVIAAEDCQVVEFPDHFEVTCTGDAMPVQIPRQAVTQAPMQAAPNQFQNSEQQNAAPQPDATAAAKPSDTAKSPASGMPYVKSPGRQGRPSSADMNAAIEARRKLIQDSRPTDQPAAK